MELSIPIKVADGDGTRPSSEDGDPVPLSADIHPRVRRVRLLVVSTEHAVTVCEDRKSDALAGIEPVLVPAIWVRHQLTVDIDDRVVDTHSPLYNRDVLPIRPHVLAIHLQRMATVGVHRSCGAALDHRSGDGERRDGRYGSADHGLEDCPILPRALHCVSPPMRIRNAHSLRQRGRVRTPGREGSTASLHTPAAVLICLRQRYSPFFERT